MAANPAKNVRLGFKASIIALFVALVLAIGLTLVYLSFSRISAITEAAASKFIDKVAELSADRIGSQLKLIKDNLEILRDLPSIQGGAINNAQQLNPLLAAMLENNQELFNLYIGYEDGSFIELDAVDRAGTGARAKLGMPDEAVFRLVHISRSNNSEQIESKRTFLSRKLQVVAEAPGPRDYDPRDRPWYQDANRNDGSLLTGPYIFFATGKHGYTIRLPLKAGKQGVVAGDVLLDATEELLTKEKLTESGVVFLFDDANRILAHPQMSELLKRETAVHGEGTLPRIRADDMGGVINAVHAWRASGVAQQFFRDSGGRLYAAAFREIPIAGNANMRLAVLAPVDEFFANILSERNRLFAIAIGFVLLMLPLVFFIGVLLSRSLRALAIETDKIQKFELVSTPPVRSMIREIDDLGRSVSTMRTVTQTFSNFVPKRLVEQLIRTGTPLQLGGTRREVSLLFTDVENFTAITEKADPSQVMQYTSRYFAVVSDEVMKRSGTVDKFIGDAIMAIWNAPADDPDHVSHACAAALAMLRANERLNAEFEQEGWPAYKTRFGLHIGEAVVGNIGSEDRMNYTALGAAVNLAARLEGLNKSYGTSILVSSAVRERVASEFIFRSVDQISPKGFAESFDIFELRCERGSNSDEHLSQDWEIIYAALKNKPSAEAEGSLILFMKKYPDDRVARYYHRKLFCGQEASL
ncbi:adenylate/guanylate cyclase domain-containing protein [Bradyrhizobium sp. SYSU BS000235]|uniref:adenylate/guanylate cyclase domain-containing protein n=1 Tax=Bradyrhizobium sp. SYSU BS000235 TaxID=3411332 RepID=UPI003C74BE79